MRLVVALALIAAWASWMALAEVSLHEVTERARLEVGEVIRPVEASVEGQIVVSRLGLGQRVERGQVLVELDASIEQRRLVEARARRSVIAPQIDALRRQVDAESEVGTRQRSRTRTEIDQARARAREADVRVHVARDEVRRLEQLAAQRYATDAELVRARAEVDRARAAASAAQLEVRRLERERQLEAPQTTSRVEELRREIAALEGEVVTTAATIATLEREIERRVVRAPVSGRVGELTRLQVGQFVRPGERLAVIVPRGRLQVVADFEPSAALGRVRRGQAARMRLHGFPWLQYGMLEGVVTEVADEPRDGTVRVELALRRPEATTIPLQHGLPGTVEVEVERVPPWVLVLRATGHVLGGAPRSVVEPPAPGSTGAEIEPRAER
ncbi:MAG: HlyD family efflux transporter periplasmic adaptor subunit [Deltaproteobacteria bacterium]|nr:HlyD family efflux transporter periplasmic adaptor subunit [Deltaproteobacteria bacterium]